MSINKKILRKFGFSNDREGIMTRYLKEQKNWDSHINNTKKFILKSAETKKKQTCAVIGSGWWLDVPVDELHDIFNEIILIDITHPAQIKHKAKKYPKLKLLEIDVVGIIEKIFNNTKQYKKGNLKFDINELLNNDYNFGHQTMPDFVVSVNILSQLAYFIKEYLLKNNLISSNEIIAVEKAIQQHHLSMMPKEKSCLVVDYYERFYDFFDSKLSENKRVSINLPKGNYQENWEWNFDLSGNYKTKKKVIFDVKGIDF